MDGGDDGDGGDGGGKTGREGVGRGGTRVAYRRRVGRGGPWRGGQATTSATSVFSVRKARLAAGEARWNPGVNMRQLKYTVKISGNA